jgi:hypothetical protein
MVFAAPVRMTRDEALERLRRLEVLYQDMDAVPSNNLIRT